MAMLWGIPWSMILQSSEAHREVFENIELGSLQILLMPDHTTMLFLLMLSTLPSKFCNLDRVLSSRRLKSSLPCRA